MIYSELSYPFKDTPTPHHFQHIADWQDMQRTREIRNKAIEAATRTMRRNIWDDAERFRPYFRDDQPMIDRPETVNLRPVSLSASLYPPCALCKLDVVRCECEPEDYQVAALAAMRSKENG